jgi:hypothetical protein
MDAVHCNSERYQSIGECISAVSCFRGELPVLLELALAENTKSLASHLQPDDVVKVSLLSQTLHGLVRWHDAKAKANLLTKTLCPGKGMFLRSLAHCPCAMRSFHLTMGCSGEGFPATTKPCTKCGVNTCDECRIHVLYQVGTEVPGLDNHRWWAGYFFLHKAALSIYPPKQGDIGAWYLPPGTNMPLHDQGRFHAPLQVTGVADPEPIDRTLDINLGRHYITPRGRTEFPYSGWSTIGFLHHIGKMRREYACLACYREEEAHQGQQLSPCSCTLRKRFLDRWLCISCYVKEALADEEVFRRKEVEIFNGHEHIASWSCRCGTKLTPDCEHRIICNWCKGCIDRHATQISDDEMTESDDEEWDEDHSLSDIDHLPPSAMKYVRNHDNSLTIHTNETRVRGEKISRGAITEWMKELGEEVECTCCKCGIDPHEHGHGHGVDGDEDNEDGEDDLVNAETMLNLFDDEEVMLDLDDDDEILD